MVNKEEIEKKAQEIENKHKTKKTQEIIKEFLELNGGEILGLSGKYTQENGPGVLFVTLVPNSSELDIEYFKIEDLDGQTRKRLEDNPNLQNTLYYAIKLHKNCYIFERKRF